MGPNYDKTLLAWYANFKKSYPTLDHDKYDERFKRMWEYYLLICAGAFRARRNQLWQVVYSKRGVLGGYKSVR
jgi:cyclopropane-fatty-acyl-phospholipid synthase